MRDWKWPPVFEPQLRGLLRKRRLGFGWLGLGRILLGDLLLELAQLLGARRQHFLHLIVGHRAQVGGGGHGVDIRSGSCSGV